MTSAHFKTSARTLAKALDRAGIGYDVYGLLNLTEELITTAVNFADTRHEVLVDIAQNSSAVMTALQDNKKITAIKELRDIASRRGIFQPGEGSLKATKDAVEDSRVTASASLWSDPWRYDHDEPPF